MKVLLFVLVLSLLLVGPVLAQEEGSTLAPLLQQLYIPGVLGAVAGAVLSYVVEWWPAYEKQSPRAKRLYYFALCVVLALVAGTVIGLVNNTLNWDYIVGTAITTALAAMTGGTLMHARQLPVKDEYVIKKPIAGQFR